MKTLLRNILIALAASLAVLPAVSLAKGINPEFAADRLNKIVQLTASQRAQAIELFTQENTALQAIPSIEDRLTQGAPIRQATRAKIRALLTPPQQQLYDTTPQSEGGGQNMNPVNMAERLDRTVALTDAQTLQVATTYVQQSQAMQLLAPEDRATKGGEIRRTAKAQINAVLTPDQQKKWAANPTGVDDLEVRACVKSFIMSSPVITEQVGAVTKATLSGTMNASTNENLSLKGRYTYLVVGSMRSENLKIYWERPFPGASVSIIKVVPTTDTTPATVQFENGFWQSAGSSDLTISSHERSAETHSEAVSRTVRQ